MDSKKRNRIIGDIIIIILLLIPLGLIIYNRIEGKKAVEYKYVETLDYLPDPIQEPYEEDFTTKVQLYKYKIHLNNTYLIQGRVVKTRSYLPFSPFAAIAPLDVGMVWGEYVLDENLDKITFKNYGDRLLRSTITDSEWLKKHRDFGTHMSHNHLIPANKKIKRLFKQIKEGDYIEIEGYLANVETTAFGVTMIYNTSTKRTDTGEGACETIYVTGIKWLKEEEK